MDTNEQIDFSLLCFDESVSSADSLLTLTDNLVENYTDQDINLSPLFQLHETNFSPLNCDVSVCEQTSVSNMELKSTSSDLSLFQDTPETKDGILSEDEPFSNNQLNSAFSDRNNKRKDKIYTCPTCNKTFSISFNLKRHVLIHKKKKKTTLYTCPTCNKTFSRNCNLQQHIAVHNKKTKPYTCTVCDKTFSRNYNLQQHIAAHNKKTKPYTCTVCDKTFPRNCYLKQHMKTHPNGKLLEKPILYDCSTCGKNFSCKSYLKQHMKIHMKGKLFSCKICLKAFSTKRVLKRHELLHNTDDELKHSFKCEYCNDTFTRKDQFNQHISYYQNSTYACTECNEKFCRQIHLKAHNRDFHTVVVAKQNPYCDKVKLLKRKNELKECSTTTFENCDDGILDLHAFLSSLSSNIENEMKYQLFEKNILQCSFMLEAIVRSQDEENEGCTLYLNSNSIVIVTERMITQCIEQVFAEMIEQYLKLKVSWRLCKITKLDILSIKLNSF